MRARRDAADPEVMPAAPCENSGSPTAASAAVPIGPQGAVLSPISAPPTTRRRRTRDALSCRANRPGLTELQRICRSRSGLISGRARARRIHRIRRSVRHFSDFVRPRRDASRDWARRLIASTGVTARTAVATPRCFPQLPRRQFSVFVRVRRPALSRATLPRCRRHIVFRYPWWRLTCGQRKLGHANHRSAA